jgi:hypothetical protein
MVQQVLQVLQVPMVQQVIRVPMVTQVNQVTRVPKDQQGPKVPRVTPEPQEFEVPRVTLVLLVQQEKAFQDTQGHQVTLVLMVRPVPTVLQVTLGEMVQRVRLVWLDPQVKQVTQVTQVLQVLQVTLVIMETLDQSVTQV